MQAAATFTHMFSAAHTPPDEIAERRTTLRLGLINGALFGLALALGAWLPQFLTWLRLPVQGLWLALAAGILAVTLLGATAGWLTIRLGKPVVGAILWFLTSFAMVWIIGHLPYEGQSAAIGALHDRFAGLPIYPFSPASQTRMVLAGFFIVLLLTILGLVQNYRLEMIQGQVTPGAGLTANGWLLLLLPVPIALALGLVADNLVNRPYRLAPQMVHRVIDTGRDFEGSLFDLSRETGVNYNAIAGLKEGMAGDYTLQIAEADLAAQTVMVRAYFDNGTWVNCRVILDPAQVASCFDAHLPYTDGFARLLMGATFDDCRGCFLRVADQERDWLASRQPAWQGAPAISLLGQQGSYVWMRADSPDGNYAIECLFQGLSPVALAHCQELP